MGKRSALPPPCGRVATAYLRISLSAGINKVHPVCGGSLKAEDTFLVVSGELTIY